jgi:hypothetical protein
VTDTPPAAEDKPAGPPSTDTTAPKDPRNAPPAAAKTGKPRRRLWLWLLLLLLTVAVGVYAARDRIPFLKDWRPADAAFGASVEEELAALDSGLSSLAQRLDAIEERRAAMAEDVLTHGTALADLERRVLAVERRANFAAASPGEAMGASVAAQVESLAARLAQVEARLERMSEQVEEAATAAEALRDQAALQGRFAMDLSGLEDRLNQMEQSIAADGRGAVIAIAFSSLRDVANRGRPFSVEYETLHDLLADARRGDLAAQLRAMAPYAASGAANLAMLRAQFAEVIPGILEASRAPEGSSWWRRFTARLGNIVIVRPTGEAAGGSPSAIIARLERRLNTGDLNAALAEYALLPSTARAASASWEQEARKRLALDEALGRFAATLLREVAAGNFKAAAPAAPSAEPSSQPQP